MGLDGYNWDSVKAWAKWFTPRRVVGNTIASLRRITRRPIVPNEIASAERGGDKALWVRQFQGYLGADRDIVAFVWFDWRKETDWRFASSEASRRAFARGLASGRFTGSRRPLIDFLTRPR